jgi:hypothetical protein
MEKIVWSACVDSNWRSLGDHLVSGSRTQKKGLNWKYLLRFLSIEVDDNWNVARENNYMGGKADAGENLADHH